jgi:hypothetical protein
MLCIIVELVTNGAMSDVSPQAADTTATLFTSPFSATFLNKIDALSGSGSNATTPTPAACVAAWRLKKPQCAPTSMNTSPALNVLSSRSRVGCS